MAAAEQVPVTRRPTFPNLSIGCALVMQILVLRVTIDLTMFAKNYVCLWPKLIMGTAAVMYAWLIRVFSGGVVEKARWCVLGGIRVVYPAIPGSACGKDGMVSGGECYTSPGHLHGTCVNGRHDLGIDCSSRDRRMG